MKSRVQGRRAWFAELEDSARDRIRTATREAYEDRRERNWQQLIEVQPPLVTGSSPGLLESATADTYLAIGTRTRAAGA